MTKYFKKTRNFDTRQFLQDFEKRLIEESEGDVFTLTILEKSLGSEEIMDYEDSSARFEA